jgi:hypothetical protein
MLSQRRWRGDEEDGEEMERRLGDGGENLIAIFRSKLGNLKIHVKYTSMFVHG